MSTPERSLNRQEVFIHDLRLTVNGLGINNLVLHLQSAPVHLDLESDMLTKLADLLKTLAEEQVGRCFLSPMTSPHPLFLFFFMRLCPSPFFFSLCLS